MEGPGASIDRTTAAVNPNGGEERIGEIAVAGVCSCKGWDSCSRECRGRDLRDSFQRDLRDFGQSKYRDTRFEFASYSKWRALRRALCAMALKGSLRHDVPFAVNSFVSTYDDWYCLDNVNVREVKVLLPRFFMGAFLGRLPRKDPFSIRPFEGLKIIDVGCGGGILSEVRLYCFNVVVNLRITKQNKKISRTNLIPVGSSNHAANPAESAPLQSFLRDPCAKLATTASISLLLASLNTDSKGSFGCCFHSTEPRRSSSLLRFPQPPDLLPNPVAFSLQPSPSLQQPVNPPVQSCRNLHFPTTELLLPTGSHPPPSFLFRSEAMTL
ncbi:Hexaprenyldihydroxybenzoate methyltransferase, mitochondrial [Dendrobium catenatum]|uniref:Hexaprenyldihydroxybenzoate methyltransferase, mitochondrial n=1 Tax=Dendrobium catenatum TaxID=906689 RepID=A0A2I0W0H9_9ASPA|nr:Hexaprenyldihydroxybenzoate methyltransferase, mitochondrial [Dendrobium catenatum]